MTDLRLAADLTLPASVVTEPIGVFANRGKGKSNGSHLLVEQLYRAGLPAIVLDIKGDWYGIRSSSDGKREGLPFLILGGEHGDVPIEDGTGAFVASFLAEQRIPAVIDLSHMSKTKARTWVMEFAEKLYRVNRQPLMLVVDEADVLIPQRLDNSMMRLLGAMEDIAKRGRQRGLGIVVISQRVADVNKSVTDLLETLFLFAITGTRTRKAILEWIDDHADPQQARDVVATLSTLEPGECWVWSPGWLRLLARVRLNRIETFDSHATPEPGKARIVPRTFADVDLSAVKEAMAATIERAKADDPRELRKRIAELQRELNTRPAAEPRLVEIPTFTENDRAVIRDIVDGLNDQRCELESWRAIVEEFAQRIPEGAKEGEAARTPAAPSSEPVAQPRTRTTPTAGRAGTPTARRQEPVDANPRASTGPGGHTDLTGPQQRIVDAIAWLNAVGFHTPTKLQAGFIAGYRVGKKVGGTFGNVLGQLRSDGLIDYPSAGTVRLTDTGETCARMPDIDQTTEGLQRAVFARLSDPEQRVLAGIITDWPDPISKQDAGTRAGYTVGDRVGGTFGNILGRLRSLGLIDYPEPGLVVAADLLFLDT